MQERILIIHPAEEGGYWGELPTLPGCFVQGETIEELLAEAPDAAGSYVDALTEDGRPVPKESIIVTWVHVP